MPASQTAKKSNSANKTNSNSQHPIADKVKETLHESVDTLAERAAITEESLRETAASGAENIADKQQMLQSKWQESGVRQYATKNPVATAGLAFAAGVLVTALLKRK